RRQVVVTHSTLAHDVEHLLEMQQLLTRQLAQRIEQLAAVDITEHQVKRRTRRLLFAMGMVDQQDIRVLQRPVDPRARRFTRQEGMDVLDIGHGGTGQETNGAKSSTSASTRRQPWHRCSGITHKIDAKALRYE